MLSRMKAQDLDLLKLRVEPYRHNVATSWTYESWPCYAPALALPKCLESEQLPSCHILDSAHNVQRVSPQVGESASSSQARVS